MIKNFTPIASILQGNLQKNRTNRSISFFLLFVLLLCTGNKAFAVAAVSVSPTYSVLCTGGSTGLTAAATGTTGAVSYSWAPAAGLSATTGAAVTATPAASTVYTVTVSYGSGSVIATTASVSVTATATAGTIGGATYVCIGSTLALTDVGATGTGTWSAGDASIATINATTGAITGIAAGTVTVTYSVTASCGTATTSAVVDVISSPTAGVVSGTYTVCPGATTTLTAVGATPGGTWTSGTASIATVTAAGVVTGITVGSTNIYYSISTTCGSSSTYSLATVEPTATIGSISGPSSVCGGSTITLADAVSAGTGTWSSADVTIATVDAMFGVVGGISSGTVSVTYTGTTGCGSASTSAVITINPLPIAGVISGVFSACMGSTTQLTDADSLGVGSWSSSSSAIATVSSTGLVSGIADGTAIISYTATNSCGAASTYSVVTIYSTPDPGTITGSTTVCLDGTLSLTDVGGIGSGLWSSSDATIASINATTGVVSGVATGTVTITYSVTTTCGSSFTTSMVTVTPLPDAGVISGTYTLCPGTTTLLTDAGSVGSGTWSSSDATVATVDATGIVTGIASGVASISYAIADACGVPYTYSVVAVNLLPEPGTITGGSMVCAGATISFSDAGSVGTGVWSSSNTSIATVDASSGLVGGVGPGLVAIIYSVTTSCGSGTAAAPLTVGTLPDPGTISGTYTVCPAGTTLLSDGSGAGTWSSDDITIATVDPSSGLVSAVNVGTANITYSVTNTCGSSSTSAPVTVVPYADPGTISGIYTVCPGATTTLTDAGSSASGIWSSDDMSVATVNAAGVVTGITSGTADVYYSVFGTCGLVTTYSVVTVNAAPFAGFIGGSTSVCVGITTSLSDVGSVGTGSWSSSNTSFATVNAGGSVRGISEGTVDISYTVVNGCGTDAAGYTLTVNPAPVAGTISGITTLCVGSTIVLSDAGSVGTGTWTSGTTGVATIDASGAVTGLAAGTTNISYSVFNSCGIASTHAILSVSSLPSVALISGSTSICVGSDNTLIDGASGGTWSSIDPSVATVNAFSGTVSGLSAGTTIISYSITNFAGCTAAAGTSVTIHALPVVGVILGPSSVCSGTISYFADATTGGTWSSSDVTVATISTSGAVSGLATGTATLSYSVSNSFGCNTIVTKPIIVNVTAASSPVVGPSDICVGATTVLVDATVGGSWSSSNTTVATIGASGVISGIAAGTATISYSFSSACGLPVVVTHVVHINTIAASSVSITTPSGTTCMGMPVTFTAIPVNGGSAPLYVWVLNSAYVAFGSTYTYTPATGDVVFCKMHSSSGCIVSDTVLSNSITLTVDPVSAPAVSVTAIGGISVGGTQVYTLTAAATGGAAAYTYSWYVNGLLISGATTATLVDTFANNDSVSCVVAAGPCSIAGHSVNIIEVTPTGVNAVSLNISNLGLFPNPNSGNFTVKGSLATATAQQVTFEVADVLGRIIYSKVATISNGVISEQLSLKNDLANGTYTLKMSAGADNKVIHFIIGR